MRFQGFNIGEDPDVVGQLPDAVANSADGQEIRHQRTALAARQQLSAPDSGAPKVRQQAGMEVGAMGVCADEGVDQAVVSPAAISITAMAAGRSRSNCSGLDDEAD